MEEDRRLTELEAQAEVRAEKLKREFESRVNGIKEKIRGLQNQRFGVLKGRISKQEAVRMMKEDLRKGREQFIMEKFVIPNLRTYQSQFRPLQNLDHLAIHQLGETAWIRFIYNWISEEMVDEASKFLDEGPTEKERNTKLEGIEGEIKKATKELEELLK